MELVKRHHRLMMMVYCILLFCSGVYFLNRYGSRHINNVIVFIKGNISIHVNAMVYTSLFELAYIFAALCVSVVMAWNIKKRIVPKRLMFYSGFSLIVIYVIRTLTLLLGVEVIRSGGTLSLIDAIDVAIVGKMLSVTTFIPVMVLLVSGVIISKFVSYEFSVIDKE